MAEMTQSMVAVVNRALVKLGQGAASYSLDSATDLGGTVELAWTGVVAQAISLYDWTFSRKTYATTLLAEPPNNGWTYGFQLPPRVGEPVGILDNTVREHFLREFMLDGGFLYTNVKPVWVRVRQLSDPDYWDEGFKEAFAMLLASELSVPLLQDKDLADAYRIQAVGTEQEKGGGGMFGKLIALNKGAQPQGRGFMADDPLTSARW
jgi:hypothetical protein